MKYVSMDSWDKLLSEDEAGQRYEAYLNDICSLLPTDMQSLTAGGGDISLNHGEIQKLAVLLQEGTVEISLNGRWIAGTVVGLRTFYLRYSGVTSITSSAPPDLDGLFGGGYGDHGFDEVEVLEGGLYEHRMLFSTGIELAIRFRGFQLSYRDVPNKKSR